MFSQRCNDQSSFRKILQWTDRVLRRPNDSLYAWRCAPDSLQVSDMNNATDGDLLIAWALIEAGARWGDASLTSKGARIAEDILRLLVRDVGSARLLIPGASGFEHPHSVIINPSSYVFPAFPALAAAYPDPAWMEIAAHGLAFLRAARFGKWDLPADWVDVPRAGPLAACIPAPGWPARFSWDAVRVPLYMIWAGLQAEPAVSAAAQLWASAENRPQPAWIDLKSGATSGYAASTGMVAIAALTLSSTQKKSSPFELPGVSEAQDYYSAVLTLKARLAAQDCVVRAT